MGLFSRLRRRPRAAVLSLDGVPHSLLAREARPEGLFPRLGELLGQGALVRLRSVVPCVSTVAWTSYATGLQPGAHGVFGFVERRPASLETFLPTAAERRGETLWAALSAAGRRCLVVNVPLTFPPEPVNGIMVGCFLAPDLERAVHPPGEAALLRQAGYRLDSDPALGRRDRRAFLADLGEVLEGRRRALRLLSEREEWDFLHLHVMETDRLFHFFWAELEEGRGELAAGARDLCRRVDELAAEFAAAAGRGRQLVLLSDHGFCRCRRQVQLNAFLRRGGWLAGPPGAKELAALVPGSRAYSLVPGRIYLCRAGREQGGRVAVAEAEDLRRELAAALAGLADPASGEQVFARVLTPEEAWGPGSLPGAPDLVAVPRDGYELKGRLDAAEVFEPPELSGMHTDHDAFLWARGAAPDELPGEITGVRDFLRRGLGLE